MLIGLQDRSKSMNKPTLARLDKRMVKVETQLEERWKETILRIKRIEAIMLGSAGAIILMLVGVLTRM